MKKIIVVIAVCALGLLASLVMGQEQRKLPPGVVGENWISIGDEVGFVIVPNQASQNPEILNGYFVARRGGSWKRLDIGDGYKFHPVQR